MEFDIKEFESLVRKMNKPSVIIYGSSSAIDLAKEYWVIEGAKAQFCALPYEDDRIFVLPAEAIESPIKLVIPEERERLRKLLGIGEEDE